VLSKKVVFVADFAALIKECGEEFILKAVKITFVQD